MQRSYRNAPTAGTIYRYMRQYGADWDLTRAGRPRAVRNDVNIARAQVRFAEIKLLNHKGNNY